MICMCCRIYKYLAGMSDTGKGCSNKHGGGGMGGGEETAIAIFFYWWLVMTVSELQGLLVIEKI